MAESTPLEKLSAFMGHLPVYTIPATTTQHRNPPPSPLFPEDIIMQSANPIQQIGAGIKTTWAPESPSTAPPGSTPPFSPPVSTQPRGVTVRANATLPEDRSQHTFEQNWLDRLQVYVAAAKNARAQPIRGFLAAVSLKSGYPMEDLIETDLPAYRGMNIRDFFNALSAGGEESVTLLRAWLTSTAPARSSASHHFPVQPLSTGIKVEPGKGEVFSVSDSYADNSGNVEFTTFAAAQEYVQREIELINLHSTAANARAEGVSGFADIVIAPVVIGAINYVMAEFGREGDEAEEIITQQGVRSVLLASAVGLQMQLSGTKVVRRQYFSGNALIENMPRHRRINLEIQYDRKIVELRKYLGTKTQTTAAIPFAASTDNMLSRGWASGGRRA